jgi:hypothetical protein
MTDQEDTHEKLIKVCMEYLNYHNRFSDKGGDESGSRARLHLKELKNLCSLRMKEIQNERKRRREIRNGKNGRPKNITIGSY